MTFNSSAGISSFANIMTVIQNCRLANISPFEYIPWYIYNLKLRALDIANSEELVDYVDSINKEVSEISGEFLILGMLYFQCQDRMRLKS